MRNNYGAAAFSSGARPLDGLAAAEKPTIVWHSLSGRASAWISDGCPFVAVTKPDKSRLRARGRGHSASSLVNELRAGVGARSRPRDLGSWSRPVPVGRRPSSMHDKKYRLRGRLLCFVRVHCRCVGHVDEMCRPMFGISLVGCFSHLITGHCCCSFLQGPRSCTRGNLAVFTNRPRSSFRHVNLRGWKKWGEFVDILREWTRRINNAASFGASASEDACLIYKKW